MRNKPPALQANKLARLQRRASRLRARCVCVILQRHESAFDYQPDRTVVTDSLEQTQTFQFKGEGASCHLVRYFDTSVARNDGQHNFYGALVSETNALGHVTYCDRDMPGRLRAVLRENPVRLAISCSDTLLRKCIGLILPTFP